MTGGRGGIPGALLVLVAVLGLLATSAPVVAAPSTPAAPVGSARAAGAYDRSVSRSDCALLGRRYAATRGCSRTACVGSAVLFNPNLGAELCASRAGKHPYATTIDDTRCRALGRRWIASVNYCASSPLRGVPRVEDAPQCTGAASTYVALEETEGYYDECLTPERVAELVRIARDFGTSLSQEASARSAVQCADRPGQAYVDGLCQPSATPVPAVTDQTLLIGDSVAWRAGDELAKLRPAWVLDGQPARKIGELKTRLDYYRSGHGQPTGLIVELGTNASPGYGRGDLDKLVASLPADTTLMFVLPVRRTTGKPPPAVQYTRWMRALARSRPGTCVADWPALVRRNPGLMLDDVHPTHRGEGVYAGLVARSWSRC